MSRRSRQVEIFNFSFLDILACTIGLLIFIMVMVFILQSGSRVVDVSGIVDRKFSDVSTLRRKAAADTLVAAGLESQFDNVTAPDSPDLTPLRDAARAARDLAQKNYDSAVRQVFEVQTQLDAQRLAKNRAVASTLAKAQADLVAAQERNHNAESNLAKAMQAAKGPFVVMAPLQRPGEAAEAFDVLHVDCRDVQVVLMKPNEKGEIVEVGHSMSQELARSNSDYQRLVVAHGKRAHALVVFWVRPNGGDTFNAAAGELPPSIHYGFEPADANWSFTKLKR